VNRFSILVVCTGNIARSPMGQRLLQAHLASASAFVVSSAGTWGLEGSPMERHAAQALAEVGVDEGGFVARELTAPLVRESDLILAATREHRAAVLTHDPSALRRVFTIRELARLVDVTAVATVAGETPAEHAARVVRAAAGARGSVRATPLEDDVADPYRASLAVYRERRDEILGATTVIAAALLGPGPA
jgi:protein-tyrosine phosphatase